MAWKGILRNPKSSSILIFHTRELRIVKEILRVDQHTFTVDDLVHSVMRLLIKLPGNLGRIWIRFVLNSVYFEYGSFWIQFNSFLPNCSVHDFDQNLAQNLASFQKYEFHNEPNYLVYIRLNLVKYHWTKSLSTSKKWPIFIVFHHKNEFQEHVRTVT